METVLLITTIAALVGAYLNSVGKWQGFVIWMVTNAIFVANNWYIGQWQQAVLFGAYLLLAAYGLYNSNKRLVNDDI